MPSPTDSWNSGPLGWVSTLLVSNTVCVLVCPLGLVVVWVIGYRGGGGATNMVKQTEVAPEWRDPASAARMVGCGGRSRERAIGN